MGARLARDAGASFPRRLASSSSRASLAPTEKADLTESGNRARTSRVCSLPRSMTTACASIATNRTPWATRSPTRKLRGGPSLRLRIATGVRVPAITPLTLMSTAAGWLENHCSAGLSERSAMRCGATSGVRDSADVSSSEDQVATPANAANRPTAWTICAGDTRSMNVMA